LADSGYQGLQNLYPNAIIPVKKKKLELSEEEFYNKNLSKLRVKVCHLLHKNPPHYKK
jgi:hypothetical protein